MKYVIAFYACVCLFFSYTNARSPKFPQSVNTWYDFWGTLADSVSGIPNIPPQARYRSPGLQFYNPGDSSLRLTTATNNLKIGPGIQYPHYSIAKQSNVNPAFIVDASCIAAIGNTYNLGDTIQWIILDSGFAHGANWYTSAYGDAPGNNLLVINPPSRMVMNGIITVDESFAGKGVQVGGSVAQSAIAAPVYQLIAIGLQLDGQNTTHWAKTGRDVNSFVVDTFNVSNGVTLLDKAPSSEGWLFSPEGTTLTYDGDNNYHLRRVFSGLGARSIGFQLINNATNAVILTAPSTVDHVTITSACVGKSPMNTHTYDATNTFLSTSFNFWIRGLYEAWMVADQIDSASINVKYQTNFTGATLYKIYRGTSPVFGSQVLIHSGTQGSFIDTGLNQNTKYYYTEYATVAAVDQFVTTFICQTRNKY